MRCIVQCHALVNLNKCYTELLRYKGAVDSHYGRGDIVLQALGVADKKSTKAVKLSTAKQRKQHAKALWSKTE